MIGGQIIENVAHRLSNGTAVRRLWCVDRHQDECGVMVEDTPIAADLKCGEAIWWQSGIVYARGDAVELRKIANSFDPHNPAEGNADA